ncbi:hypothetical protein [Streptomyces sp. NPDC089799]|uniref:hypothetical protein n=1 Tax=Streptomyces sp. NPDC089799 TaxID=3155066 RepID=UPI00343793AE
MEELVEVVGKVARGVAGLAYAFGDTVMALGGPEAGTRPPKDGEKKDEQDTKDSKEGDGAGD